MRMLKNVSIAASCVALILTAGLAQARPGFLTEGLADSYTGFEGLVFDIAALPNGGILVAVTAPDFSGNTILEISPRGTLTVAEIPTTIGSPINGLEPIGQRNFFATSGGQDLALGAALWRVSAGNARKVGDIESHTLGDWPDGQPGPYPVNWKDFRCEEFAAFSHGPQTNPYHLTALSGSEVLIGDAANNGLLWAKTNGEIDWVAFMDPPLDPDTGEWLVLGYVNEDGEIVGIGGDGSGEVECYIEPVPTSVAVGPDGFWYVGELTGAHPDNFFGNNTPDGLARIWRIEPGTRNVQCPSSACTQVLEEFGFNSVIDVEFGPDGMLYLVEFDRHGFFVTVDGDQPPFPGGGTVQRCDLVTEECEVILGDEEMLIFPGAITFDASGSLWLVDNVFAPTVRRID